MLIVMLGQIDFSNKFLRDFRHPMSISAFVSRLQSVQTLSESLPKCVFKTQIQSFLEVLKTRCVLNTISFQKSEEFKVLYSDIEHHIKSIVDPNYRKFDQSPAFSILTSIEFELDRVLNQLDSFHEPLYKEAYENALNGTYVRVQYDIEPEFDAYDHDPEIFTDEDSFIDDDQAQDFLEELTYQVQNERFIKSLYERLDRECDDRYC